MKTIVLFSKVLKTDSDRPARGTTKRYFECLPEHAVVALFLFLFESVKERVSREGIQVGENWIEAID